MIYIPHSYGKHGNYVFEYDTEYIDEIVYENLHSAFYSIIIRKPDNVIFKEVRGRLTQHLHFKSTGNKLYLFNKKYFDEIEKQKIEGYMAHQDGYNKKLPIKHPYRLYRP